MQKFTNSATVVPIILQLHPNADSLSIVDVFGSTVVVATAGWAGKSKGVYIPVENYVPTNREEFAFLKRGNGGWAKVKDVKLRGVHSNGLLVPCPDHFNIGDDVTEYFGVKHIDTEPEIATDIGPAPASHACMPKYDIDSFHKLRGYFNDGEEVYVTEKIHGQNASFVYIKEEDKFYAKARNKWMKEDATSSVWQAFHNHPQIAAYLKDCPYYTLCGEVYGHVKGFRYDVPPGTCYFRCFDMRRLDFSFRNFDDTITDCAIYNIPAVPLLYIGPYTFDKCKELANGQSTIASHIREGCVVKPYVERQTPKFNRLVMKIIGEEYSGK